MKRLLLPIAILFASSCSQSGMFHVTPDSGNLQVVINKASSLAAEGAKTKVVLHGGEYRIDAPVLVDSVKGSLTICAAKGETPILDGSVAIRGWQKSDDGSGVWKVRLNGFDLGIAVGSENRFDLYCNGRLQTLARWPNNDFSYIGPALGVTPTPENWANYVGSYEGLLSFAGKEAVARLSKWAEEPDGWMLGYWFWDWYESYQRINAIDAVAETVKLEGPDSEYGYREDARFYALNMLCELDAESEFYLDRRDSTLYWYPPKGIDPEAADVRASVFSGKYMLSIDACEGVTIDGLTFRYGRNGAVNIEGGRANILRNCTVEMFGDDAVNVHGDDHLIAGCHLRELGCGGIVMKGGDRKNLEPSGLRITGTTVDHFSLYKHTYKPAVLFEGTGLHLDHCLLRGSSSSALRFQGNDLLIEYNIFEDLVNESDDQGGLDTWYDLAERGNVIRYNYWKDITGGIKAGAAAIRFDDMISGQTVYGNIIENCGGTEFGGVQIHGGRDNRVFGNVFINCPYAVSCLPWDADNWEEKYIGQNEIIDEYDIFSGVYTERYPELNDIQDGNNNRNFIYDNLAVDVPEFGIRTDQNEMWNNTSISSDGHDTRYFTRRKVLKQYGVAPIPFDEIGPSQK